MPNMFGLGVGGLNVGSSIFFHIHKNNIWLYPSLANVVVPLGLSYKLNAQWETTSCTTICYSRRRAPLHAYRDHNGTHTYCPTWSGTPQRPRHKPYMDIIWPVATHFEGPLTSPIVDKKTMSLIAQYNPARRFHNIYYTRLHIFHENLGRAFRFVQIRAWCTTRRS